MKKTSANRYMPGTFDFTKDLCEIMAPNSTETFLLNFANSIYKKSMDRLKQIIHPCPYSVSTTMRNNRKSEIAIFQGLVNYEEVEDEQSVPSVTILESGNYRTDVNVYSKSNVQYINLKVYFSVNLRR
jgi:ATP-dependent Zn protease